MVSEVIRETHDSATLVLFTGNDRLDYKPGHFLTIDPHQFPALERFIDYFEEIKGKREPARAYSLTSAPRDKHLAITIKEEYYVSGFSRPGGYNLLNTNFMGVSVFTPPTAVPGYNARTFQALVGP